MDNLSLDYTQLQEWGIIVGMIVAVSTALFAAVKRIYCKGKNDSILNERITLLETWKEIHTKEYEKLQQDRDAIKEEIYKIGKSLANIEGILEGNGTKE